jgi:oligosaccharide reducing-end xylanase
MKPKNLMIDPRMTGNQIMKPSLTVKFGAALLLVLSGCALLAQQPPTNGSGAFATGHYRNLFVEAGHSQAEVTKKVNAVFQQFFYGDASTQALYYPSGFNTNGALAYIYDTGYKEVRSEGMSYGLMIAVQLNKKTEFDAIWNWARTYMYHSSPVHPSYGFFSWSMKTNGTPNDEMPAPDGEEYFVTALYFASGRWGNGAGIYNYRAEADRLLTDMQHREWITGRTRNGPKTADALFDAEHHLVRLTPDKKNCDRTDPSYHLPAFYELWAKWGPKADQAFWEHAAAASRNFFQRAAHPLTGLTPDFANFDGTPWVSPWNRHSADFGFDAWRTAMNWSVDWAWWAKDVRERQLSDRLQAFFETKGMTNYGNEFKLDGDQFDNDHSPGLMAINAVAGLAATQPRAQNFVEELWNAPVPTGQWRYYDGMLYFMGLLHCSGEFRIWPPQTNAPSPSS